MIERIIIIEKTDPVTLYGVNNANMQLVRNLFPKTPHRRPGLRDKSNR